MSKPSTLNHDDVIKWKHFPRNWPFVWGIHLSPVNSLHKGQWRRALMFSLICIWINDWVNTREAGDLRCYRAHYDVIVMSILTVQPASGGQAVMSPGLSICLSVVFIAEEIRLCLLETLRCAHTRLKWQTAIPSITPHGCIQSAMLQHAHRKLESSLCYINPLRAKLFKGNKNIYSHILSVLHIDLTQVLKILPQVR